MWRDPRKNKTENTGQTIECIEGGRQRTPAKNGNLEPWCKYEHARRDLGANAP